MARITKIEATKSFIEKKKIRVAAYARVSTRSDEQLLSLETQKEHYDNFISANSEWEYAGLYYDEGVSGTKGEKRDGLLALLKDCEDGKIDRVITKSISRFSRNTADCLEMVRNLARLNIYMYFEKENIDTEHMSSELMLSILSSIAESESRSISQNNKWSIKHRFEEGTFIISYPPYGYENEEGRMVIVPEKAAVVRDIFNMTINGMGTHVIARELNERGVQSRKGTKWHPSTVRGILQNEKYAGNMLLQKRFRENHLTKRMIRNDGQLPKYFVEESHLAIIEKSIFDAVQKKLEEQHQRFSTSKSVVSYPFTGKIQCTCCGKNYRHKITATGNVWICATYNTRGKKYCPTAKQIPESTLISVCCEILSITEFDANIFENQVEKILVPAPNKLIFQLTNGKCINTTWKDRSRSESWTEEKRAAAAESSKTRRWKKCQK